MQMQQQEFHWHIKNGPVLYTNSTSLSGDTKSLNGFKTKTVIVLGSTSSVSNNVVNQVKKMGISTQRISGKTDMSYRQISRKNENASWRRCG